jgi:hypothetical protein
MWYIITCILCIALVYITKCYTMVYEKTRVDYYKYWNKVPWKEVGKPKFPRWYIILSLILSFIPILNIFLLIGIIVNYITVASEPSDNNTNRLTIRKLCIVSKFTNWLFEKV